MRDIPITDQFDEILQEHPIGACAVTIAVQPDPKMDAPKVARRELLLHDLRPSFGLPGFCT